MTIVSVARKLDYDRTLAAVAAKAPVSLFALNAFNAELGAIRAKVSDPIIYEIRLLWWREAIHDIARGVVRKHPVIEALVEPLRLNLLDGGLLDVMISERFKEFSEPANNFKIFIDRRASCLEAFYMASSWALRAEEDETDFTAFRAFDLIRVWQAVAFYESLGLAHFRGPVDPGKVAALISLGNDAKTPYFKGLAALSRWYFKGLEKTGFEPANLKKNQYHPGKFLALWRV